MRRLLVFLMLVLAAAPAAAQGRRAMPLPPAPTILERLERMSPEQRRRFFDRLPEDRRERIEARWRAWERLSPREKMRLRRQLRRFREFSPEQQAEARRLFRRFQDLPPVRRRAIRAQVFELQGLSESARQDRFGSQEFRNRFNEEERRIIEDMLELAPER